MSLQFGALSVTLTLLKITISPRLIRNDTLYHDLPILTVNEVIQILSTHHESHFHTHCYILALFILDTGSHHRRLHHLHPLDHPA